MKSVILLSFLVFFVMIYNGEGHMLHAYYDGHGIEKRSPEEHCTTTVTTTTGGQTNITTTTTKGPEIGAPFNAAPLPDSAWADSARRKPDDIRLHVASGTPKLKEHASAAVVLVCLMVCLPKEI